MLLAQNTNHKVIASAPTRLILIHAGSLSDMIINDPEWNVEKPVVLPIPPALAHTLNQIEYYMKDKYKPYDKAGGYGIQEWIGYIGVEAINGSFYNVMGLPVQKLYQELKHF